MKYRKNIDNYLMNHIARMQLFKPSPQLIAYHFVLPYFDEFDLITQIFGYVPKFLSNTIAVIPETENNGILLRSK